MENSIQNEIAVWKNEKSPHALALKIIDSAIKKGLIKPVFKTIVAVDCPFSRDKIDLLFSELAAVSLPSKFGDFSTDDFPSDLKLIHGDIKIWYTNIDEMRGVLKTIYYTRNQNQRRNPDISWGSQICFDIIELQERISSAWRVLDYYRDHRKRMPGTTEKEMPNELKRAAELLDLHPQALNYVAKEKAHRKKTGALRNPAEYRNREQILKEIEKFKETHG